MVSWEEYLECFSPLLLSSFAAPFPPSCTCLLFWHFTCNSSSTLTSSQGLKEAYDTKGSFLLLCIEPTRSPFHSLHILCKKLIITLSWFVRPTPTLLRRKRSFHSDRDLKSMEKMLEVEKALLGKKKADVDKSRVRAYSNGGFEAPRNSLDVPAAGIIELRRHSEVQCDDIPIGYELSRSLTARSLRRNDEFLARKSMSSVEAILSKPKLVETENAHTDRMSRPPSVVARLMGLDPLPQHPRDSLQCSNDQLLAKKVQPHELVMSESDPSITKQRSMSHLLTQRSSASIEKNLIANTKPALRSSKALPFRDHPQEKQLQEFKKELEGKLPMSSTHMEKELQGEKQGFERHESLQESQEFLDALNFLHSNKEFFFKVLKDPSSLFAKHLQERGSAGASKQGLGHVKGSKLNRSLSESKTRVSSSPMREPHMSLPLTHKATQSDKTRSTNQLESLVTDPLIFCSSHFGQDEHMPQRRSLPSSPRKPENDKGMPTKIVVLRPKLGRVHGKTMSSVPFSPPSDMSDARNMFVEGKEATAKADVKERLRSESMAATRNHPKDHLKDVEVIARHAVQQVKVDTSKRLVSEKELASLAKSSSRGYHIPAQGGDAYGNTYCTSDGEGYCLSSRSMTRDSVRANVSLPSSPRHSRSSQEVHSKHFSDKGTRDVCKEKKLGRVPSSSSTCRNARRDNVGVGRIQAVLNTKQGSHVRDPSPQSSTRRGRNKGSLNDARELPKVLQRSLSATSVEIRNPKPEHIGSRDVNRLPMACSNTSKLAESSVFKERLLSLKDSLSLSKTKSKKKSTSTLHGELASPNRLANLSDFRQSNSTTSTSVYAWRAPTSSRAQKDRPATEGCQLDDGGSVNRKAFDVVDQWPLAGDLLESASDASLEKCEQPSPVSVLVTPFDEESLSPEQSASVCHEASLMRFSPLELDYKKRLLDLQGALFSSSMTLPQSSFKDTLCDDKGLENPLETLSMQGIACACGTEDELVYIRDLLAFAGFTSNECAKAHAFSREHAFNPSLFQKMESYYASIKGMTSHEPQNLLSRRMLFDVADEILLRKLGEPTWQLGPIKQEKLGFYVAHTGKEILEQIWAHVYEHRYMPCEYSEVDSLDALALKDLTKDDSWMLSQTDMEAVALELEKSVCGDLIREMTQELKLKLTSTREACLMGARAPLLKAD
ncbi:hypothetical protein GOP47_0014695 [Adiantum capillus-veneris]|uniref:Uncharacterized protein n=1 Tax=Adiantum capillus-veneris TaxID=13818 RepID=A0A9D4UMG2_ADICA|nr:hypothetical protein GOP47_0014695 [Adiantum capillus-veneris]